MRRAKAQKAKAAPPQAATTPRLTSLPAGYEIQRFGSAYRPVLVIAQGDGLDGLGGKPQYRELAGKDGRTGAVCASEAEALAVIAAHQVWKRQQAEMARDKAKAQRQQAAKAAKKGAK